MKTDLKMGMLLGMVLVISACGSDEQQPEEQMPTEQSIPITVTSAKSQNLEIWVSSVGQLEAKVAPLIAAEVGGRLTAVYADVGASIQKGQVLVEIDAVDYELARDMAQADIDRLQALIHAQKLMVKRYQKLIKKKSIKQSTLDDADAQLGALQAELVAAQVRLQQAQRDISRTRITSSIDGYVDETMVSKGDYVKVGTPLMRIGNLQRLKARLPYPETLLPDLKTGLPVRLLSPSAPEVEIETTVSELRPSITVGSRSAQVIVNVENPGPWRPGASVIGEVRVAEHPNAIVVPEGCVIRRPSGLVVYKVNNGRVAEITVTTGLRDNGNIEILSGVQAGDQLALDGAAYLDDGVSVDIKETNKQSHAQ